MNTIKLNLGISLIALTLLSLIACSSLPPSSNEITPQLPEPQATQTSQQQALFKRRVDTPLYSGNPAIIFRLDDAVIERNEETLEQIIRLFGKYNIPLDVGVIPQADGQDSFEIPLLKRYLDAGIIDLSIYTNQYMFDTSQSGTNGEELKADLVKVCNQIEQYFGVDPIAFTIPHDSFNEEGYKAVQDAGFKIFSAPKAFEFNPTVFPVDYTGQHNEQGMSRLCTVSDVVHWDANKKEWGDILLIGPGSELSQAIQWGLTNLDVAIVGIHPDAFLNKDLFDSSKIDEVIRRLLEFAIHQQKPISTILKSSEALWGEYTSRAADLFLVPNYGYEISHKMPHFLFAKPNEIGDIRTGRNRLR